jgi:hypothetical protein
VTKPAAFRQSDVERACKGALGAGLQVARVRVSPDGSIDIIISDGDSDDDGPNPLEQYLNGKTA